MDLDHFSDDDDTAWKPAPGKPDPDSAERPADRYAAATPDSGEDEDDGEDDEDGDEELDAGEPLYAGRADPDRDSTDEPVFAATAKPGAEVFENAGPSAEFADGLLLDDADGLRANWQHLQAGFIDDPRGSVAEAADLVEHATQSLVGALRQRQQQLRVMWDGAGSANGAAASEAGRPAAAVGVAASTEQFRQLVQRYRVLFNYICRP